MDAELPSAQRPAPSTSCFRVDEVSSEDQDWITERLPQASFQVWRGSGPFPLFADPERFAHLLAPLHPPTGSATVTRRDNWRIARRQLRGASRLIVRSSSRADLGQDPVLRRSRPDPLEC